MLFLIGLGLGKDDLSLLALETAKRCQLLFVETYTATLPEGYVGQIEAQVGKKAVKLSRGDMEERVKQTVSLAKEKDVAIMVPGDPLIATTHAILLNEARAQGIGTKVIHAPSVFSIAVGESGLDVYKFGPTATIPFWSESYKPVSFLDVIDRNLGAGLHTLVLLDLEQGTARPMRANEAKQILLDALQANPKGNIGPDTRVLVMASIAREDASVTCTTIAGIGQELGQRLSGKMLSIVFPGKTSFAEEENLSRVCLHGEVPST